MSTWKTIVESRGVPIRLVIVATAEYNDKRRQAKTVEVKKARTKARSRKVQVKRLCLGEPREMHLSGGDAGKGGHHVSHFRLKTFIRNLGGGNSVDIPKHSV